jgi:hypothetical protein
MRSHLDDITSLIVAILSRAWDYHAQHAHMHLWPARTTKTSHPVCRGHVRRTYIFLLFVNVANLKPNVGVRKRTWGIPKNAVEASQGLVVLPLLFVYYAQTK